MDKIEEVLTRGVEKIYPSKEALEKVLRSNKKVRLYQGFDPSMPNLHLGNMVGVLKLKQFQDLGHEVIFLVGDFTGMIGDPTDKTSLRSQLSRKQVLENCKNWKEQASRVLNFSGKNPAQLLYNSQWLSKISFAELLNLGRHLTYQQTIKRDMFRKRLKQDKDIYLHEFLYPLMQGYDSVHMNVDLEIGGSDQMFNMLVGRDLMKKIKNKEKFVLTTKLLIDSRGEKVGKTTGNALFLNVPPNEMYGGIMSFPDDVVPLAFELLTLLSLQSIKSLVKELKPMDLKKKLAFEIVRMCYSEKDAKNAEKYFEEVFQKGEQPGENTPTPSYEISAEEAENFNPVRALVSSNTVGTASEAKRLISQGGVDIDGSRLDNYASPIKIKDNSIIRAGKKKFLKIKVKKIK
ncbi:tyrosine--tRNA ligase [Patescibacteria group bacterium]|nr:tyrosine--tRNA ligase [Patescibacteria group bacterium]